MTIEEFGKSHGGEPRTELVRGEVIRPPSAGRVVSRVELNAEIVLGSFVEIHRRGRLAAGARVRTEPETLRVADIAYRSSAKVPRRPGVDELMITPPDMVLEVRLPTEAWLGRFMRVVEYLKADVAVVLLVDVHTTSVSAYRQDAPPQIFEKDQTLTLPDVLPGFAVPVARFFEE